MRRINGAAGKRGKSEGEEDPLSLSDWTIAVTRSLAPFTFACLGLSLSFLLLSLEGQPRFLLFYCFLLVNLGCK